MSGGLESAKLQLGLQHHWDQQSMCDVSLQSNDGATIKAHRVVLSAASEPLSCLLTGSFLESNGSPVQIDAPQVALKGMLNHIYGKQFKVPSEGAVDLLKLAHLYDLKDLVIVIVNALEKTLDTKTASELLSLCPLLGLHDLEERCEDYLADKFEEYVKIDIFSLLSAAQLGRLLSHPKLVVPREEICLEALLKWSHGNPERNVNMGVLLYHIRFELLSESTLNSVYVWAESAGACGHDIQREVRKGLRAHKRGRTTEDEPCRKRPCLRNWWSEFGSSVAGKDCLFEIALDANKEPLRNSIARQSNGDLIVTDSNNHRVLRWPVGAADGIAIAGRGAATNGITDLGAMLGMAISSDNGAILIVDAANNRILEVHEGTCSILGNGQLQFEQPVAVGSGSDGAIYVLDGQIGNQKVQRIQNGRAAVVAGGRGQGEGLDQFDIASSLFVTGAGTVFISEIGNNRIVKWRNGATVGTVVAGGNGSGAGLHQLHRPGGLWVDVDETVYVADTRNHRVVKWLPGASHGVVVAGGHGKGRFLWCCSGPVDVCRDGEGALYVYEVLKQRVAKWGPSLPFSAKRMKQNENAGVEIN